MERLFHGIDVYQERGVVARTDALEKNACDVGFQRYQEHGHANDLLYRKFQIDQVCSGHYYDNSHHVRLSVHAKILHKGYSCRFIKDLARYLPTVKIPDAETLKV